MKPSKCLVFAAVGALAIAAAAPAAAQAPNLQERAAALKESLVKSQALLKQYEWIETRVLTLKGEEKNRTENRCYYGPDGTVIKEVVSATPEQKARGLKGKIVEKKKAELTDYMKDAGELIKTYVPPDPAKLSASKNAGKMSVAPEGSRVQIDFRDYEKTGDALSFELDTAKNSLLGMKVSTWLKDAKDTVTMTTTFGQLDDGAVYPAEIVLSMPSKSLEVKTTNSGHKKR
jgi:hypothetical protein